MDFFKKHEDPFREGIVIAIVKLLSCKSIIRGYQHYQCTNTNCSHIKRVWHTCKSRACSSCGKKPPSNGLPNKLKHFLKPLGNTLPLPCHLNSGIFFWLNRSLLHALPKLAADCLLTIADKKKVTLGIFTALHTFGRDLKRNTHVHLSTTQAGITHDLTQWKSLFFNQTVLMRMWRQRIIQLFRNAFQNNQLTLPQSIQKQLNPHFTFLHFLDKLYQKTWIVHCAKSSDDPKININYFARYIKRLPIAESRLKHYDGNDIVLRYLDHQTKTYRQLNINH